MSGSGEKAALAAIETADKVYLVAHPDDLAPEFYVKVNKGVATEYVNRVVRVAGRDLEVSAVAGNVLLKAKKAAV